MSDIIKSKINWAGDYESKTTKTVLDSSRNVLSDKEKTKHLDGIHKALTTTLQKSEELYALYPTSELSSVIIGIRSEIALIDKLKTKI